MFMPLIMKDMNACPIKPMSADMCFMKDATPFD